MESTDYIFGIRAVIEAIEAGKEIDKVFIRKDLQGEASKSCSTSCTGAVCRCSECRSSASTV